MPPLEQARTTASKTKTTHSTPNDQLLAPTPTRMRYRRRLDHRHQTKNPSPEHKRPTLTRLKLTIYTQGSISNCKSQSLKFESYPTFDFTQIFSFHLYLFFSSNIFIFKNIVYKDSCIISSLHVKTLNKHVYHPTIIYILLLKVS